MKLKELQKSIKSHANSKQVKIAVISNISFEPYFELLINKTFLQDNRSVKVIPIDYSGFLSGDNLEQIKECDFVAVIPNFNSFYHDLIYQTDLVSAKLQELINKESDNYKQICSLIHSKLRASTIWFSYEDYCFNFDNTIGTIPMLNMLVDNINMLLLNEKNEDTVFIDFKKLIAIIGINNAYDNKNKYRWNSPYSQTMIEQICNEIYKQYLIVNGKTKKCIVLDCDNVLWEGILSEDGIENIHLGSSGLGHSYQDFQRYLLFLYNHGAILTISSKNDMADVMRMFREHSEMILKEEHIACFQVNWNNKADNIKKISETLNMGLDSIVFIDDSDFEIESVKQLLPEVTAIKYERDTIYSQLSCFNLKNDVDMENIRQRNNTYKTNEQRVKLKDNSKSFENYLNALDMEIDIHPALPIEYSRISELTQRTNKCTNGIRYTIGDIKERIGLSNVMLYSVAVSDRFSDLGIVGAFEIEGDTLTIFSLSCRSLGRNVENIMVKFILEKHQIHNIVHQSTGNNDKTKNLLTATFSNATITNREIL